MTLLTKLNACPEGREWADSQSSYREAWESCERGDWMLWIAAKQKVDLRKLTGAKVDCAWLARHLMTDKRSLHALYVAERFSKNEATREQLNDAYAGAYDAGADAAAAAAYAAAAAAAAVRQETLEKCANIVRKHIKFEDLNIKD